MSLSDDLVSRSSIEQAAGRRHLARLFSTQRAFLTGDFKPSTGQVAPLAVVPTTHFEKAKKVAFLASFRGRNQDCVFALRPGLNRVGYDPMFGDYVKPPERIIESRQWLVVCASGRFLVMDDKSTNESIVLPRTLDPLSDGRDPRNGGRALDANLLLSRQPGIVKLDWAATTVHELVAGDVLVTIYGALVFGEIPERG